MIKIRYIAPLLRMSEPPRMCLWKLYLWNATIIIAYHKYWTFLVLCVPQVSWLVFLHVLAMRLWLGMRWSHDVDITDTSASQHLFFSNTLSHHYLQSWDVVWEYLQPLQQYLQPVQPERNYCAERWTLLRSILCCHTHIWIAAITLCHVGGYACMCVIVVLCMAWGSSGQVSYCYCSSDACMLCHVSLTVIPTEGVVTN